MRISKTEAKRIGEGDAFSRHKIRRKTVSGGNISYRSESVEPQFGVLWFKPDSNFSPWENIDSWMKHFTVLRSEEMKGIIELARAERKMQANKFGSTKDNSLRRTLILPTEISIAIKRYYPNILKDYNSLTKLAKMFRGLSVVEKI